MESESCGGGRRGELFKIDCHQRPSRPGTQSCKVGAAHWPLTDSTPSLPTLLAPFLPHRACSSGASPLPVGLLGLSGSLGLTVPEGMWALAPVAEGPPVLWVWGDCGRVGVLPRTCPEALGELSFLQDIVGCALPSKEGPAFFFNLSYLPMKMPN